MKKCRSTPKWKADRSRRAGLFGLVMTALVFCCFGMAIPSLVHDLRAAETTQDSAAAARKLQLEGSRLQLQGDLAGAIKKYQASLSLQPNPRLETLLQQLEKQTGATEPAIIAGPAGVGPTPTPTPKGPAETPAAPAAGGVPVAPGEVVSPGKATGTPVEPPSVVQRTPGTPEEELIFAFTDWALSLFPQQTASKDFSLKTNRDYAITQAGGQYEVRLEPFILSFGENDGIDLSPMVLNFKPRGKDKLAVTLHLPKKAPFLTAGKTEAELTIGSQDIFGVWDRNLSDFDQADLKLANLAIQGNGNTGRFDLKDLIVNSSSSRNEQGIWDEKVQGNFSDLSFADDKSQFNVGKGTVQVNLGGSNFARYAEVKKNFQRGVNQGKAPDPAEMKKFLGSLDQYIQTLGVYTSSMAIQGVKIKSEGDTFSLDSVEMSGGIRKDDQGGRYRYDSKMEAKGGRYAGKEKPEKPQPVTASLNSVGFFGEGSMKLVPPNMFADLSTTLEGFEKIKKEETEAYLLSHGTVFARKILELIEGYSSEINLNGLKVLHVGPDPMTLETARLRGGFEVGTGEGGKIHTLINFSGFNGPAKGANNIPQSANLNFELKNIPSLLPLIADPTAAPAANVQQVQGQAMMKAMNALMMSALTCSLTDSFVVFPASRVSLSLLANIDSKAKYFSTGNLNLAIENPDEFLRIAQSFGADPEMQKMLVSLTALANRGNESGKIVDKIDAKVNQEGKVFVNAKDVTLMFFPEPVPPRQGPTPKNTK